MITHTNPTILLVEDDENDVLLVQRAFRKSNHACSIQVVGDGEAALNYLQGKAPFDDRARCPLPQLILLDLKLPRCSGFEVLEWIKSQEILNRIPIAVLTSSRVGSDVDHAYDLGANSYLVKPVTFDGLMQLVNSLSSYWLSANEFPHLM